MFFQSPSSSFTQCLSTRNNPDLLWVLTEIYYSPLSTLFYRHPTRFPVPIRQELCLIYLQYPELSFAKNKCLINSGVLKKTRIVQLFLRNQKKVVKLFLDITSSQTIYTELTSITLFSDFSKVLICLILFVTITGIKKRNT